MLTRNYLNNMSRNLNNMSLVQNQLASGKEIQRGSENPRVAVRSMQLNTEIDANEQYNTNIQSTTNWLDTTDTALGEANNIVKRINTLMIKAGNGAYSPDEIAAINDEIKEKVKEFTGVINTSFDGNFIFGGSKSTSKPLVQDVNGKICYADKNGDVLNTSTDPKVYDQIKSHLTTEISEGIVVEYNKTASDVLEFKNKNNENINVMDQIANIITCLNISSGEVASGTINNVDGSTTTISDSKTALEQITGKLLGYCTDISANISKVRSNVGAMQNRMESSQKINEDQTYNMTNILSETEDIDFAEKTMEYSVMQTVYTASLQTSAKVLTNTIMDYI
jgi:flagellar hook-associated protein 3 FlgL